MFYEKFLLQMNIIKSIDKDITNLKLISLLFNQNNKNRATISVANNVEIIVALDVVVVVDPVVVAILIINKKC